MNFFILVLLVCLLSGCGKQDTTKLAKTHFKMAFLEASEQNKDPGCGIKALAHCDKALEYDKKPEYMALKATLLFKAGHYNESQKAFEKALDLNPDRALRAEIENNFACLLAQLGDYEKAQKLWEQVCNNTSYQTPEVAYVNMGKVNVSQNKLRDARLMFTKAAVASPGYIDAHFYKGLMSYRLSDMGDAREEMKVVLLLEPEHPGAKQLIEKMDNL